MRPPSWRRGRALKPGHDRSLRCGLEGGSGYNEVLRGGRCAKPRIVFPAVAVQETMVAYLYELRRGDIVVAIGHLSRDDALEVGEHVVIGGQPGIVHSISPQLIGGELRLVVQLTRPEPG